MMSKHYQKITAPIHRSTAYDFNVQLDHVSLNKDKKTLRQYTPDVEQLGVKEHEILVRYTKMQHRYKDNRLRVFSALNNIVYTDEVLLDLYNDDPAKWQWDSRAPRDDQEKRDATLKTLGGLSKGEIKGEDRDPYAHSLNRVLHKQLAYVGVAITPQNLYPKHSRQDSQGFACSRGGLNTIINTGNKSIT